MADDAAAEPYREFIREITLRFERAMRAVASEIREETRAIHEATRAQREENREYFEALRAEVAEHREESRAQTKALLHILGRLGNGGTAPAA